MNEYYPAVAAAADATAADIVHASSMCWERAYYVTSSCDYILFFSDWNDIACYANYSRFAIAADAVLFV